MGSPGSKKRRAADILWEEPPFKKVRVNLPCPSGPITWLEAPVRVGSTGTEDSETVPGGATSPRKRKSEDLEEEEEKEESRPARRQRLDDDDDNDGEAAGASSESGDCRPEQKADEGRSGSSSPVQRDSQGTDDGAAADDNAAENNDAPTLDRQDPSEGSDSDKASTKASESSTPKRKRKPRGINGLINDGNACYINSVIQLVDASMEGHDLDSILGGSEGTEALEAPEDDRLEAPAVSRRSRGIDWAAGKLQSIKKRLRSRIEKCKQRGERKQLSLRKHLRSLIDRMRLQKRKDEDQFTSPDTFKEVFVHGDENWTEFREHLTGDTQQDCYEYFQSVINGLLTEEQEEGSAMLESLFSIKGETTTVCSDSSCDYKGEPSAECSSAHTVAIPETSRRQLDLISLLDASRKSDLDTECPKCGQETLQRVTSFKQLGENLVLQINRVGFDGETKIKSRVELPLSEIELCGKKFVLNTVIRHRGTSANNGHYTAFRRRSSEWVTDSDSSWYHMDDEHISTVEADQVRLDGRHGQSAMLLFKAA